MHCETSKVAKLNWRSVADLRRPVATTPAPATTIVVVKPPQPPVVPGFCRADQAKCQSGECIPRDYICDGESDCLDGSDEVQCGKSYKRVRTSTPDSSVGTYPLVLTGTPSPCEPNEFKCKNGRCALKLWRCDGDNDCDDNSDELDCRESPSMALFRRAFRVMRS